LEGDCFCKGGGDAIVQAGKKRKKLVFRNAWKGKEKKNDQRARGKKSFLVGACHCVQSQQGEGGGPSDQGGGLTKKSLYRMEEKSRKGAERFLGKELKSAKTKERKREG